MVDPFAPFDEHRRPIVHAFADGQLVVNISTPTGNRAVVLDGQDATDFEADLIAFARSWAATRWPELFSVG